MTNIISIFSRDLAPTNGQVSGVVTELELMRRQAAIMPLRKKLTVVFVEIMSSTSVNDVVEQAIAIHEAANMSLEGKIVETAIEALEALKTGFMPQVFKVA